MCCTCRPCIPLARRRRKGPNNSETSQPGRSGQPMGHRIGRGRPQGDRTRTGNARDFDRFVRAAEREGLEIALDIAFQCSPDHPYVTEHPEWFRKRPDGSIKYAENPPKKYQDIFPLDFDTPDWEALWHELRSVVLFWIERGVRIFRVDNPHTKPFAFWEWLIRSVHAEFPDDHFPRRSVHAPEGDEAPRQARVHAVLHVFHLAQREARARGVLHRAHENGDVRVLQA